MNPVEDIADIYELSPLQQGMLFHCLLAPGSGLYLEQISVPLNGRIHASAFQSAWQQVLDRHATLRTSFHWEDLPKPLQVVHRTAGVPMHHLDWRKRQPAEWRSALDDLLQSDRAQGFVFTNPPLLRLTVIQLTDDALQLVLSFHHLLVDGWSLQILLRDFATFYDAACRLQVASLGPIRPYGDYIAWIQSQDPRLAEAFWRRTLAGFSAPTPVRLGRLTWPETEEASYGDDEIRLSAGITSALQALARQHQLTVSTITQGAWAQVLSRCSGETDVVFGTIVSGRPASLPGVEEMVGMFINTLPVRVTFLPDESVLTFLQRLRDHAFEARNFEYASLMEIQGWSEIPRGTPLYESVLVFENYPMNRPSPAAQGGASEEARDEEEDTSTTAGDLSFQCVERTNVPLTVTLTPGRRLSLKIVYDRRRFSAAIVRRMLGLFRTVLEAMASDPTRPLRELPVLPPDESRQLLVGWNDTAKPRDYDADPGILGRFEAQVRARPDAVAFLCGEARLSYRDLEHQSRRILQHLRRCGVGRDVKVAVCLDRDFAVPATLLAIFRGGGVYVPLDPGYPTDRLMTMLEIARPAVLVTHSRLARRLPRAENFRVLCLDALEDLGDPLPMDVPSAPLHARDLAYIIFTSGSTGRPKGVAVEHRQILNRLHWLWEAHPFAAGDVACQKTALSFVDSLWELLGPLLQGIPTVILSDEVIRDPAALVGSLGAHGVSSLWLVPSLLHSLLEAYPEDLAARVPSLRSWVSSGEALSVELYRRFRRQLPGRTLYNLYGTSEVWDATWYDPDPSEDPGSREHVPIGRPISNVQVYVLDSQRQLVPIGVPGELCVGGHGLARGYLNADAASEDRFIPHPFSGEPGARLYRTGDLVRWREDGQLEFLGRLDRQIKLRGYRIEPGEIEAALENHSAVRRAVVISHSNGAGPASARLVAYLEMPPSSNGSASHLAEELRRFLPGRLPEYMVPSDFVMVSKLPMTPSGKVDARALPAPNGVHAADEDTFESPRNDTERRVAELFCEVLGLSRVGTRDHFFTRLGGNSLQATQLTSRVRNTFGIEVPLRRLFEAPTTADYALVLEELLIRHISELSEEEARRLTLEP